MKRFLFVLACAAGLAWVAHTSQAAPPSSRGGCCGGPAVTGSRAYAAPASCANCPTAAATASAAAPVVACAKCLTAAALEVADKEPIAAKDAAPAVTLEGTIVCSKCALKQTAKCGNAILVKEDGKTVTYYFIDKGNGESYHESVCGSAGKAGTVVGTVVEKDGKKYITPSKVTYKG